MAPGTASASLREFLGKGNSTGSLPLAFLLSAFRTPGWSFVFGSCFIFLTPKNQHLFQRIDEEQTRLRPRFRRLLSSSPPLGPTPRSSARIILTLMFQVADCQNTVDAYDLVTVWEYDQMIHNLEFRPVLLALRPL